MSSTCTTRQVSSSDLQYSALATILSTLANAMSSTVARLDLMLLSAGNIFPALYATDSKLETQVGVT